MLSRIPDHSLTNTVRNESVGLLFEQSPRGLLGSLIAASILVFIESSVIDTDIALGWLAAMIAISVIHLGLLRAYRHSRTREIRTLVWHNLFVICIIISAIIWGSSGVLLFAPESIPHQTFLMFILAGVSAVAALSLAPALITAVVFLTLALFPAAVQFLLQGSELQVTMGGMVIVFLLFLVSQAWWTHSTIRTSLMLRHENIHLMEHTMSANGQLQSELQRRSEIDQQMKQAKEEAERANKSKSDFLATISHEIRTPMNSVLGTLELMQDMPLSTEHTELVSTAHDSADSLIRIINDVLDFSKIEAGRLELEKIDFDPHRLVSDVTALLSKRALAKGLQFSCKISRETPETVHGDPTRLRQILSNLIDNAVKFTDRGQIEVRVSVARNMPASTLLRFEVEDTGIGMSSAIEDKLFRPFTQADNSMARRFGGTGLGLSISKQLVELMGGQLGVDSTKGEGSTFWFTTYLTKVSAVTRRRRKDLNGVSVLILTEDQRLQARLTAELQRWRASFEFAVDAAETMEKLRSSAQVGDTWSYDVVILDVESDTRALPSLVSGIRSDSRLTGTALVVIGELSSELQTLEKMAVCLPLPLKLQALFDTLITLIEDSSFFDIYGVGATADDVRAETIVLNIPKPAPETAPSAPQEPASENLRGQVLLVEDNPVNQKVAKNIVERLGLSVDLANDGFEAVETIAERHYAVVLMDCQMPGMDGFAATRAIRDIEKDHNRQRMPIIAVTANAMEGDRERCLASGMDDYLAKPFKRDALQELLAKWLPAAKTDDAVTATRGETETATPEQEQQADAASRQVETDGHILVADDDPVNRQLARAVLKRLGYGADLAANGREAVTAFQAHCYNAVLMDCEMPELDGFDATREIRRIEQQRDVVRTPIIAFTGHINKSDHERCTQAGMDAILTKPLKFDLLAETLRKCLSSRESTKETPAMRDSSSMTSPTLDQDTLSELQDIMEGEFEALVQTFLQDVPARIYEIRDGIQARDTEAVRVASHTLKSSAAGLGAQRLSTLAEKTETLARGGTLSGSVELLKLMAEEFKRVRSELRAL